MPAIARAARPVAAGFSLALLTAAGAFALQPSADAAPALSWRPAPDLPLLDVSPTLDQRPLDGFAARAELAGFRARYGDEWQVRWDLRADRPHLLQGRGLAFVPGSANRMTAGEAGLGAGEPVTLEVLERRARALLAELPELLGVGDLDLRLERASSFLGDDPESPWFVELAQYHQGVRVEGASVFFRGNHGNLVQFGADRVAPVEIDARPASSRDAAFAAAWRELGLPSRARLAELVEPGELLFRVVAPEGEEPGERFTGVAGSGYRHRLVWRFVFRLEGDDSTWEVTFDAQAERVLAVRDLTVSTAATVTAGIYPTTNTDPEVVVPLPFATVSNGSTQNTDAAGVYDYTGGTATCTLDGQFFKMTDNCGAISLADSVDGNLAFGASGGTDCSTPGVGGAGNTHASRSGFYHLTNINRKAITFLPGNSWLLSKVTANMNINLTCNAFWNGSTLNFYRSGGGCSNTGEIAAVFLHEWGHGLDTNTGGAASENGSGEAVGDTFAFLETRDPCIGQNFQPGINCPNCTACTGVRDVADFGLAGPAVIAKPANVADNAGINCDRFITVFGGVNCPYLTNQGLGFAYQGPMGYEGHCESVIASSANWDLTQSLVATLGTEPGWAAMDRIWYSSLTASKSAYELVSGGKCNPGATVDGCAATNWYTAFLAADDDDGNLANGTPNGCRIWSAFDAHGIACGSQPACFCGATAVADAGPDQAICPGGSVQIGTPAVAGRTYSWSPGGATTAQITVSPSSTTIYTLTVSTACNQASDDVTVTVGGGGALAPALVAPADGATGVQLPVTLQWSTAVGAVSYAAEVASDAGFASLLASSTTSSTSTLAEGLPALVPLFWRVRALDVCGGGTNSSTRSFTVTAQIFSDGFESHDFTAWTATGP
jgi:hypothetical protein